MFVVHLDPWCVSNFMDSQLCLSGPYWVFSFVSLPLALTRAMALQVETC